MSDVSRIGAHSLPGLRWALLSLLLIQASPVSGEDSTATPNAQQNTVPASALASTAGTSITRLPDGYTLTNRRAMRACIELLNQGIENLSRIPSYTATLIRRERVDGELQPDDEVIALKFRREPFSVYMKWDSGDRGREALFVAGRYNNKLIVRLGGLRGRFIPAIRLDPAGSLAMAESRYSVTDAGLEHLAQLLLAYRRKDLAEETPLKCELAPGVLRGGLGCYRFQLTYLNRELSNVYRHTDLYIDKQHNLPIRLANHTWPADESAASGLGQDTLIEYYRYEDLDLQAGLTGRDFNRDNPVYRLRR